MRNLLLLTLLLVIPLSASRSMATPRDFNAVVTEQDKRDIRYIVLTLAASNALSVLPHANELNEAGDRIKPVHPLPFLEYIFTHEDLKVGIRNLKKQNGELWHRFMKGLAASLEEEANRGNLTDEQVEIFAKKVGVDPKELLPLVHQHRWKDLVNTLIAKVPRKGEPGRYDM